MYRLSLIVLSVVAFLAPTFQSAAAQDAGTERPQNVILFIPDGFGPAVATFARDYKRDFLGEGASLVMDGIEVGSVRTWSTDSRVTDSAAGATAYAAGEKTYNGAISVDTLQRPLGTILQGAKARGMATGVVSTARVTHATPAAFTANVPSRDMENEIARQQLDLGPDVIIGGGRRFYEPENDGGRRTDGVNLLDVARERGYSVANEWSELRNVQSLPVLSLLNSSHLPFEIDRDASREASLAELTEKTLELLAADGRPFFVMIEAGRIDHGSHANDPQATLHETLAYDAAIEVALRFARADGNTLIVGASDHETGGMTLGRNVDGRSIYGWEPEVIARVQASQEQIVRRMLDGDTPPAVLLQSLAGIDDLTEAEAALLEVSAGSSDHLTSAVSGIISRRARVGWTTNGHTAVDVKLHAFGPGSDRFVGNYENAYVGRTLADLLNIDLDAVTNQLRAEAAVDSR